MYLRAYVYVGKRGNDIVMYVLCVYTLSERCCGRAQQYSLFGLFERLAPLL